MKVEEGVIECFSDSFSVGETVERSKTSSLYEKVRIIIASQACEIMKLMNPAFFTSDRDIASQKPIPKQQLKQLYTSKYTLTKPMVFDVSILDGLFYIYNREFGITGSGITILEAKEEAADTLINLYEYYNRSNRKKSKELLELIESLNRIIRINN